MIYLLLLTMIVFVVVSYILFNRDIMTPSIIVCTVYSISVIFAIYNINNWRIDYQFYTYFVVVLGVLSFVVTGFIISNIYKNKNYTFTRKNSANYSFSNIIIVDKKIALLFFIVEVITTIVFFREVYRISIIAGNTKGYFGMISYYRNYIAYNIDAETVSTLLTEFLKLCNSIGLISLYILVNNFIVRKSIKRDGYLFILVLLAAIQSIISGTRGDLLMLVTVGITSSYVIGQRKAGWSLKINISYIIKGLIVFLSLMFAFYYLKTIVRIFNTNDSIIDYISVYAGGSIQLFNLYLKDPISQSAIFGKETFVGIYNTLNKLNIFDTSKYYLTNANLEFRLSNGIAIGNVYGAFRRYYQDFGLIGLIILQSLSSVFFHTFYQKIKNQSYSYYATFSVFLYTYIAFHLFEISIDDNFYKTVFSLNWATKVIMLYFVYFVMCKIKFRIK